MLQSFSIVRFARRFCRRYKGTFAAVPQTLGGMRGSQAKLFGLAWL